MLQKVIEIILSILPLEKCLKWIFHFKNFFIVVWILMTTAAFAGFIMLFIFQTNLETQLSKLEYEIKNDKYKTILFKNILAERIERILKECGDKSYIHVYIFGEDGKVATTMLAKKCEKIKKDGNCIVSDNMTPLKRKESSINSSTLDYLLNDEIKFKGFSSLFWKNNEILILNLRNKNNIETELLNRLKSDYYQIHRMIVEESKIDVSILFLIKRIENDNIKYVAALAFTRFSEIKCSISNFKESPEFLMKNIFD